MEIMDIAPVGLMKTHASLREDGTFSVTDTAAQDMSRTLYNQDDQKELQMKQVPRSPSNEKQDVEEEVRKNNEIFKVLDVGIRFEVDDETKDVIVKVVDEASGKIIRQIPPEEVLKMRARLQKASGMIYNDEV